MARRLAWPSAFLLLVVACSQDVTAPGACPEFCPATQIRVIDSVVVGSIARDSSFRGYVAAHEVGSMQVSTAGVAPGEIQSRAVLRFRAFADSVAETGGNRPVTATDSFRIDVAVLRKVKDVAGLELVFHRLPVTVDSTVALADVEPFFDDSTVVGTLEIPDSVTDGRINTTLPPDAFPTLEDDSLVTAIGIALRALQPGFVELGATEGAQGTILTRFVKIDSTDGELAERIQARGATMDTFVIPPQQAAPLETLVVGGLPSARTLLRVRLPPRIVDSANVVRATLIVVPSEPVRGVPGDTLLLFAEGLSADFGPKSPILATPLDTAGMGIARVAVGSQDTVRIDVTRIVLPWRDRPNLPRSFMLRVRPEGAVAGEVRFGSSRVVGARPAMHVTYIPPPRLGR